MITQKYLKEIMHYDPDTGLFTNLITRSSRAVKGQPAGSLNNRGYIDIRIKTKLYRAHRLAFLYMTGKWPKDQADHRNEVKNDNRWSNLREATSSQNKMNTGKHKDSTSGFKGVSWHKANNKWQSQIGYNKKVHYLGYFNTKEEAHEAYKKASKELHKKFSNFG